MADPAFEEDRARRHRPGLADYYLDARARRVGLQIAARSARGQGPLFQRLAAAREEEIARARSLEARILAAMERDPVGSWELIACGGIRVERLDMGATGDADDEGAEP